LRPAAPIRRALSAWYRRSARDLPWRRTKDPYGVWVSEVMLQQTTVATATPRWRRFLSRFPDVGALARASEREVLAEWSGLGYYARARNLHRAARTVAAAGSFPGSAASLRRLPGVGPYTAAAVASICFGEAAAVVDGNVVRVLSRLFALRVDPKTPRGLARIRERADALLEPASPGDFNQAVMELGATVCTPRAPACGACPLRRFCAAARQGRPESYPMAAKRRATTALRLVTGLVLRRGRLVLVEDRHLVPGQLVTPLFPVGSTERADDVLRREWRRTAGREAGPLVPLGRLRHSVLERRYVAEVFTFEEAEPPSRGRRPPKPGRGLRLLRPAELSGHAHGGFLLKVLSLRPPSPGGR
jgi:A/G-specific adenine glycosylase